MDKRADKLSHLPPFYEFGSKYKEPLAVITALRTSGHYVNRVVSI
jgi:hypothetical protein